MISKYLPHMPIDNFHVKQKMKIIPFIVLVIVVTRQETLFERYKTPH